MPANIRSTAALTAVLLTACAAPGVTPSGGAPVLPPVDETGAQRLIGPEQTVQTLSFPPVGSTKVSGRIIGYKSTAYAVPVATGQTLVVTMESPSDNAYFNVQNAADSSGAAVFRGEIAGRTARIHADSNATYLISPFQPRASARRNESASYSFTIERQ
jgi:hypothetical protein